MTRSACLFILSGPSGAGKGTLCKVLRRAMPELALSVSYTTRACRPGEMEGREYRFISLERFDELIREDAFLEWADVHGNRYGTRRDDVETCLARGGSMILEIDVQGCRQVKARMPQAVRIFITVPSLDELESRLEDRGTETPEQLDRRLHNAAEELAQAREYEHIIVNDDVNTASQQLIALVRSYVE